MSITIGQTQTKLGVAAMLDFRAQVALGDELLTPADVEALLAGQDGPVFVKGRWIEVDREKLGQAIAHWRQIERQCKDGQISFIEGMRLLAGAPADLTPEDGAEEHRAWAHVEAGETMRQVLALLASERQRDGGAPRRPSLLVVPASLLGNWQREAQRFTPSRKLAFLHPALSPRDELDAIARLPAKRLAGTDLVVTTYAMLARQSWLADVRWRMVIPDEAQAIKNAGTRQSKAVKKLAADARIALTGTPIESRLGDLWSLFDFLHPGLLGSSSVFKTFARSLAAREHDQYAPLRRLVGPYTPRRLESDRSISADLPEQTETARYCSLTRVQVELYEQAVRAMERALADVDSDTARRGLVLTTLMRLKQICNHPSQAAGLSGSGAYELADSGKSQRLAEIAEELAERQEKVLVFTQFREIIDPLAEHRQRVFGRPVLTLHGGTSVRQRREIVERFQAEGAAFLHPLARGGRHRSELDRRVARDPPRSLVESDRRESGHRPRVPHRAAAARSGAQVHHGRDRRAAHRRADRGEAELAEQLLASDASEVRLSELPDERILELVRLDAEQAMM